MSSLNQVLAKHVTRGPRTSLWLNGIACRSGNDDSPDGVKLSVLFRCYVATEGVFRRFTEILGWDVITRIKADPVGERRIEARVKGLIVGIQHRKGKSWLSTSYCRKRHGSSYQW